MFLQYSTPPPTTKPRGIPLEDDANNLVDESMDIVNKAMDVDTRSNVVKKNATRTTLINYQFIIRQTISLLLTSFLLFHSGNVTCFDVMKFAGG